VPSSLKWLLVPRPILPQGPSEALQCPLNCAERTPFASGSPRSPTREAKGVPVVVAVGWMGELGCFLGLQVIEDLVDDDRVLNAGNDLHRPADSSPQRWPPASSLPMSGAAPS
jgi:hypothetical protein